MWVTWFFTVPSDRKSAEAISLLLAPGTSSDAHGAGERSLRALHVELDLQARRVAGGHQLLEGRGERLRTRERLAQQRHRLSQLAGALAQQLLHPLEPLVG
jgi:hypothetical protein